MMNIYDFWKVTLKQDADAMRQYFHQEACVRWHNTNELFNVDEFIIANCEYPDDWDGEVERVERLHDLIITVTHVYAIDKPLSFHVTSFIQLKDEKIISIDEYWGDDGEAPQWRLDKHIGKKIHGYKNKD